VLLSEPSTEILDDLPEGAKLIGTEARAAPGTFWRLKSFGATRAMELITILNRCHRFPGFVYHQARFTSDHKRIEISVRPRKRSAAICSRCHQPAPGYDQLPERRFEFIPLWGFFVFLLYAMRRVDCRRCGAVIVEEVPWGDGKRTLTRAYMLFLARWARRLSWKETAEAFRTSWEKVFDAVEHVVTWGLEHRILGQIDAIGVDEIQSAPTSASGCEISSATTSKLSAPTS
jgi:transposase